jgi:hypothetical protein
VTDPEIRADVRQLLVAHIESYEQLETLLLLHQRPDRLWTPDEVGGHLKIPALAATTALEHLRNVGLVRVSDEGAGQRYKLGSLDSATGQTVAELANAYAGNRLQIMQLLTANAIERVRSGAIRLFADAFVLGRGKKDG